MKTYNQKWYKLAYVQVVGHAYLHVLMTLLNSLMGYQIGLGREKKTARGVTNVTMPAICIGEN